MNDSCRPGRTRRTLGGSSKRRHGVLGMLAFNRVDRPVVPVLRRCRRLRENCKNSTGASTLLLVDYPAIGGWCEFVFYMVRNRVLHGAESCFPWCVFVLSIYINNIKGQRESERDSRRSLTRRRDFSIYILEGSRS
jgi:hypothetical protein